jgi:hypothetical protein
MLTFNNKIVNENNIQQQGGNIEPSSKTFKTFKYEKTEIILLEWCCQKQAMNIPVPGSVL